MDTSTQTPWLSPEQQVSWRDFMVGTTALTDQLDRELRQAHGLSLHEYEILVRLSESKDNAIRMAELASSLSHSRSRITHTISRLERAGFVRRGQCSEDGRGVSAVMTEAGRAGILNTASADVASTSWKPAPHGLSEVLYAFSSATGVPKRVCRRSGCCAASASQAACKGATSAP